MTYRIRIAAVKSSGGGLAEVKIRRERERELRMFYCRRPLDPLWYDYKHQ